MPICSHLRNTSFALLALLPSTMALAQPEGGYVFTNDKLPTPAEAIAPDPDPDDSPLLCILAEEDRTRIVKSTETLRLLRQGEVDDTFAILASQDSPVTLLLVSSGASTTSRGSGATIRTLGAREVSWYVSGEQSLTATEATSVSILPRFRDTSRIVVGATVTSLNRHGVEAPTLSTGDATRVLLVPARYDRSGDGLLHGRMIGIYPNEKGPNAPAIVRDNADAYTPPESFYLVEEGTLDLPLAEGIALRQLAPPPLPGQEAGGRFVALPGRVLPFFGALRSELKSAGIDPAELRVLRGFVSPNERDRLDREGAAISPFSRHLYGDGFVLVVADVLALQTKGPMMRDLNGDGSVTVGDSEALATIVEKAMRRTGQTGGIGIGTAFKGPGPGTGSPYVHADLRGWSLQFREE